MRGIEWETFRKLRGSKKKEYFLRNGNIFHVIMSQQFDRKFLDEICELATKIRGISKGNKGVRFLQSLLQGKRAMLYFVQPSTRTFLSFMAACQILGIQCSEVRDTSTSSEVKGESQEDTVRTFSSYVDLIIMRHPQAGFAERIAFLLNQIGRPVPVINAGSGRDQHPTQALLDIYTLHRSFENYGGIDGKKIAFVGDLLRGRTVRSLAYLLRNYKGVKLYFVAPKDLQMGEDLKEYLREQSVDFEEKDDLEEVIPLVDAVYMTRIQDEYDEAGESKRIDYSKYHFKREYLKILPPNAIIMHPLPRREEIPVEIDEDKRAMYWRQVRNGMWVRVALIAKIFRKDRDIMEY
ncbi:MAG: aspartate carbamoyltransferase [Deltaproteobacteria bacterium]|nr:MAG: aspartate carbamoyltransferase [Deltaproteobacteria bacterium]